MYSTGHLKTAVACYLVLNAFYVDVFSEINLTSVKLIISNDFCDLE